MNKIQRLSLSVFALGICSLLAMLKCETISYMLNLNGLCALPIATTNMIGSTIFIVSIIAFGVLLVSVYLEIEVKKE